MTSGEVDHDLLAPLMEGAFEQPPWATFLERLRVRTGAIYASLIFRPPAPSRPSMVHLYAGEPSPPIAEQLYRESLHAKDPMPYHQLGEGQVYGLEEFLRPGDPAHEAYRELLLAPSGVKDCRVMRIVEPSGVNVWLNVSRRVAAFEPWHDALIAGLAPYLRSALRGFVALERERFNASVSGDAIRRLNFGWLSLDRTGCVLDADAWGANLLAESTMLRRGIGDRLTARRAELGREIADAIRLLADDPRGRPRAIVLSRDPWLDMLLVPAHGRPISSPSAPAVIDYVHGDSWSSADRCEQLAELFELLPSESRLALALSRGMTIAEAAGELGLTVETARNYSKKIYAKTGARGQPDLVRFIHRSVLAIA
jgi:DNA-binding CsgD family transcriptional regulator